MEDEASCSPLAADVPDVPDGDDGDDGDDACLVGEAEVRPFTLGGVGLSSDKSSESSNISSSTSLI